jgi:hypothetical protein
LRLIPSYDEVADVIVRGLLVLAGAFAVGVAVGFVIGRL